jgi:hypothetical protein
MHGHAQFLMITETFATEILEDIIMRQELSDVHNPYCRSERFFARYAGIIMHRRFSVSNDVATTRLKQLLELLLEREGSGLDTVREQYSADLCKAISGDKQPEWFIRMQTGVKTCGTWSNLSSAALEGYLPAAAAAVGNISLLQKRVSSYDANNLLGGDSRVFPKALNAAVASNQTEMVTWMLGNVRGRDTEDVRYRVVEALQVATRSFHQDTSTVILGYLAKDEWRPTLGNLKEVVQDCMIYGNVNLLEIILEGRKTLYPGFERLEAWNGLAISTQEMEVLYFRGSRGGLLDILGKNPINPDEMGEYVPLDRATYCSRYDLARAILDAGANIETRDRRGSRMTALQRAAMRGFLADVQFLLDEGADPDSVLCLPSHGHYCREEILRLCKGTKALKWIT